MKPLASAILLLVFYASVGWTAEPAEIGSTKPWWAVLDVPELPGDRFEKTKVGPPRNVSREDRRWLAAEAALLELRIAWEGKNPEELISLMCFAHPKQLEGVSSILADKGNEILLEQLLARGETARAALKAHVGDQRVLYNMLFSEGTSLGQVCEGLLSRPLKVNRLRPKAGRFAAEAEVTPGVFVAYYQFDIAWELEDGSFEAVHTQRPERRQFFQMNTTYLATPWQRVAVKWVGVGVPITLRAWQGRLYLIVFDRESDFSHIRFRYYEQNKCLFTEIAPDKFPKAIATQNLWLSRDNGIRADHTRVDEVEIVKAMNPEDIDFQRSLTAKIWVQCETGKEFFEVEHETVDQRFLKTFRAKYDVIGLPTIERKESRKQTPRRPSRGGGPANPRDPCTGAPSPLQEGNKPL